MDSERRGRLTGCAGEPAKDRSERSGSGCAISRLHCQRPAGFIRAELIAERDHPPLPAKYDTRAVRIFTRWEAYSERPPEVLLVIVERSGGDAPSIVRDAQPQLVFERQHLLHQHPAACVAGEERIGPRLDDPVQREILYQLYDTNHHLGTKALHQSVVPDSDYLPHGERRQPFGGMIRSRVVFISVAAADRGDDRPSSAQRRVRERRVMVVADRGRSPGNELVGKSRDEAGAIQSGDRDVGWKGLLHCTQLQRPTTDDIVHVIAERSRRTTHDESAFGCKLQITTRE